MSGTYRPTIIRCLNAQGQRVSKSTPGAKRVREKSKTFLGSVLMRTAKFAPSRCAMTQTLTNEPSWRSIVRLTRS